ncbi:DNA-binding transcriptional LysR family regulator [Phenylobacterium haematophilum]|jgi:DNA-binding transcriptional LysR family regulator|uniref:DNA-binding transcriptional LysR family regulator n=1 Tax=Phenylobacterium haematophilum TaxID=98513 RepID=A0A839ZU73_9CAUL|nr:LysR substrate-binding domain-containing protein [Phenylobacterium haematophilum]MBB3889558.1 DNA-binding transcriptional LysR family regulator [Phenylobacterium haematophilum]
MRRRLPPLSALRAFEAVARLGSVGRAAEELGRTHGAVSKQLQALRLDAGVALFDKVGTGLAPNAAGKRLAQAVGRALDDLGEAYGEVVREARAPALRIACSASFAMGWLAPRLSRFSKRYPDVRLQLSMTSAREMREERDADLVILWDRAPYPAEDRARAIRLADATFGPVAAPDYPIARRGEVLRVGRKIAHDHTAGAWAQWSRVSGLSIEAPTEVSFPHTHLCLQAAAAGMGVAVAERRLADADLTAGRLVAVAEFASLPDGFAALPHRTRPLSPQAQVFVDWLRVELDEP